MNDPNTPKRFLTKQFHARWRHLAAAGAPFVLALGLSQLALAQDPIITQQPTNTTVELGDSASFTFRATTTNGPLSGQWQRNDPTTPVTFTNIPNARRTLLILGAVTREHAGDYRAIIANAAGDSVTSQVARLEVIVPQFTRVTQGSLVNDDADEWVAVWGDYDGDGDLDMTTSGGYWAAASDWTGSHVTVPFANQADGTFAVASPNLFATSAHALGINWADADNDGDLDAWQGFIETQPPKFFLNLGDWRFERISVEPDWIVNGATVRGSIQAWGDYDNDGWVDLAIASPGYASANPWPGMILRNTGNSRFTAADLGLSYADSMSWVDLDEDGDLDLLCMNGSTIAFRNEDGELVRMLGGEAPFSDGGYRDTWADFDNDGDLDVLITKWPGQGNSNLWRNDVSGFWSIVDEPSLRMAATASWNSAAWGDYDNDGDLDLFIASGNEEHKAKRNHLLRNNGPAGFVAVVEGRPVTDEASGRHCSWVDYDNDGDLDLYVVNGWTDVATNSLNNFLYRNNGNANHWLKVALTGRISNRSAIGAKVRVKAVIGGSEVWQLRVISAQAWTQELVAHFGLGDADTADTLRIEWPSGVVQELKDVTVDQQLEVVETQGVIPPPQPMTFEAFGRDDQGVFQATVNCPVEGVLCVMEASSDFERWSKVQVRTNLTGTVEFTDAHAVDSPTRFYRVLVP